MWCFNHCLWAGCWCCVVRPAIFILLAITYFACIRPSTCEVTMRETSKFLVQTKYGRVRGVKLDFSSRKLKPVLAYLGLRYASIGSGQFRPPISPRKLWTPLNMATQHAPVCPQAMRTQAELRSKHTTHRAEQWIRIQGYTKSQDGDCLSLNMYVPQREWNETQLLPVMVFIHGDAYDAGTGNAYDGSVLASYGRIIVVTLNYRLGILGFLTTGANIGSGNYALMDIVAALLWLKENIANFGGDPEQVTLFGHGHGAALVHLLLISPVTKDGNLFRRGILMSGSALSPWAMAKYPLSCTQKVAEKVNCTQFMNDARALINCFRETSVDDLIKSVPQSPKYFSCFAPTFSSVSSVLPQDVADLMKSSHSIYSTSSLLFGLTRNEAFDYLSQQEMEEGISELRKIQIVRTFVHNTFQYQRQKVYEILDHHYTEWNRNIDQRSRRDSVLDLLGDGLYVAPLIRAGETHAQRDNTYFYLFNYASRQDNYQRLSGSIHGDELAYVFGAPLVDGVRPFASDYKKADRTLAEAAMTYWTNFVKTGDPKRPVAPIDSLTGKIHSRFQNLKWPTFDLFNHSYLQIAMRPKIAYHYRGRQMALWLDLIPKLHKNDGGDPRSHLLRDSHNLTLFDDADNLDTVGNLFPLPIPTTRAPMHTSAETITSDVIPIPRTSSSLDGSPNPHNKAQNDASLKNSTAASSGVVEDNSVQVSITIAVGCSLLFLNILIFAGIYHQRERILKLRASVVPPEPETGSASGTLKRANDDDDIMAGGPETVSLLSTATSHTPSHMPADNQCHHPPSSTKLNDINASLPFSYTSTTPSSTYVPLHKLPTFSASVAPTSTSSRAKMATSGATIADKTGSAAGTIVLHDHNLTKKANNISSNKSNSIPRDGLLNMKSLNKPYFQSHHTYSNTNGQSGGSDIGPEPPNSVTYV